MQRTSNALTRATKPLRPRPQPAPRPYHRHRRCHPDSAQADDQSEDQEVEESLLLSCHDDDDYEVTVRDTPTTSAASDQSKIPGPILSFHTGGSSGSGAKPELKMWQPKSIQGKKVFVQMPSTATAKKSKPMSNVMLLKMGVNPLSLQQPEAPATTAADTANKKMRPAAWLLHSAGLRMVRERVYDDLIEVQEEKEAEGALGATEHRQLSRLQAAHAELAAINRPLAVRARRRCRCGFAAGTRHELAIHQDYGSVWTHDDGTTQLSCCLCSLTNIRSTWLLSAHIERCHGRPARSHALPPIGFCQYCPFEQRTVTKVKLTRHLINCAMTFRLDRNLAPTAADADIPLLEVQQPPVSSTPVESATSTSSVSSKTSASLLAVGKSSASTAVASMNSGGITVSAAGPVMTAAESPVVTLSNVKISLAKLARIAPLPEGIGFEVCELCGAFLASRESLIHHLIQAHRLVLPVTRCLAAEKPLISCDKCTERFWTVLGLSRHVGEMHEAGTEPTSPPRTVCPLCKRTRLTDVVEHLARQHRITLVDMFAQRYCSVCQFDLHAARAFERHMTTTHADMFPDRASLYAAIVMVDRATRGRAGMVGRGRQLAVLAGATGKPGFESIPQGSPPACCPICCCSFADAAGVQAHLQKVHAVVCTHCGRRCTSASFLRYHVRSVHGCDTMTCDFCNSDVGVMDMSRHLLDCHTQACSVIVTPTLCDPVMALERMRPPGGSECSDSMDSSTDDCVELTHEAIPAAKKPRLVDC